MRPPFLSFRIAANDFNLPSRPRSCSRAAPVAVGSLFGAGRRAGGGGRLVAAMSELNVVDYGPFIARLLSDLRLQKHGAQQAWGGAKRKCEVSLERALMGAPPGDQRIRALARVLNSFEGFPRSEAQKRFHAEFTKATLPHVYGQEDFERHRDRVLSDHGMDRVRYEILVRFSINTRIARTKSRSRSSVYRPLPSCVANMASAPTSRANATAAVTSGSSVSGGGRL